MDLMPAPTTTLSNLSTSASSWHASAPSSVDRHTADGSALQLRRCCARSADAQRSTPTASALHLTTIEFGILELLMLQVAGGRRSTPDRTARVEGRDRPDRLQRHRRAHGSSAGQARRQWRRAGHRPRHGLPLGRAMSGRAAAAASATFRCASPRHPTAIVAVLYLVAAAGRRRHLAQRADRERRQPAQPAAWPPSLHDPEAITEALRRRTADLDNDGDARRFEAPLVVWVRGPGGASYQSDQSRRSAHLTLPNATGPANGHGWRHGDAPRGRAA